MEIHERIKAVRVKNGLSQTELAAKIGIAYQNYWNLENGKTELTVKRLFELATILGVSPLDLLGLELSESNESQRVKELEKEVESLKVENRETRTFLSTALKVINAISAAFTNMTGKPFDIASTEQLKDVKHHDPELINRISEAFKLFNN